MHPKTYIGIILLLIASLCAAMVVELPARVGGINFEKNIEKNAKRMGLRKGVEEGVMAEMAAKKIEGEPKYFREFPFLFMALYV
ncbi:hypothetical protein TWF481_008042 [Arthrobotrys musiformis]|uniref:Uncharacterized protein n=1 Tax=Arthrobotrys musiformis TaxID=47236 RepID=A0AAV9W5Y5_9PEZI